MPLTKKKVVNFVGIIILPLSLHKTPHLTPQSSRVVQTVRQANRQGCQVLLFSFRSSTSHMNGQRLLAGVRTRVGWLLLVLALWQSWTSSVLSGQHETAERKRTVVMKQITRRLGTRMTAGAAMRISFTSAATTIARSTQNRERRRQLH